MGIMEILTIIFVVLKLSGVIAWSWWLVLLPVIISFSLYIIWLVVFGFIFGKVFKGFKDL